VGRLGRVRGIATHDVSLQVGERPGKSDGGHQGHHSVLHLPSPLASLRHSLPALLEGVVGPFVVFYIVLLVWGFKGALIGGLAWSYAAIGTRLVRRQRPSATLLLGSVLLTARTVVSFITGSALLYFAQPTAGTCLVALLFLGSALLRKPFIERLARDFCPLDPAVVARPAVRRFFIRISLLWAVVLMSNAAFVLWLLFTSSLHAFVVERTAVSWTLTLAGTALSVAWFVRTMRRDGIAVRFNSKTLLGSRETERSAEVAEAT
jgi:hypothetical protein